MDEIPEIIMIHTGSNDISKTVHDYVNSEDLAQQIANIAKKCRSFGAKNIAILCILMRKNVRINKKIKKVNKAISSMCAVNGFHFIYNDILTTV